MRPRLPKKVRRKPTEHELKVASSPEGEFTNLTDKEWLNPHDVLKLQDAVHNKRSEVILQNRIFRIQYHDYAIDDHGIVTGKVFVKVVGNYAPCGWFSINELLRYEFEGDHDKHL